MDIRVQPRSSLAPLDLGGLASVFGARYPKKEDLSRFSAKVELKEGVTTSTQELIGYSFRSADESHICQARLDGWSYSKLTPYENWESFQEEAKSLWQSYVEIARPEARIRIALRYVNRIDLPLPIEDFSQYLNTIPTVGAGMPQGLAGFFMQLQIPYDEVRSMLVVNQAMVPPPSEEVVSIVLDLDLFRQEGIPQNDDGMWALFEQLRRTKNDAFEACLTDAARELFA